MKVTIDTDITTMQALMKTLELSVTIQSEMSYGQRRFLWEQLKKKLDRMHILTPKEYHDSSEYRR